MLHFARKDASQLTKMKVLEQCDPNELLLVIKGAISLRKVKYNIDFDPQSTSNIHLNNNLSQTNNEYSQHENMDTTPSTSQRTPVYNFSSSRDRKINNRKASSPIKLDISTENRFKPLEISESNTENAENPTSNVVESQGNTDIEKEPKIPPIVFYKIDAWTKISRDFKNKKYNYFKAKNAKDIKIFPCTSDDWRNITSYLDSLEYNYHTYELPNDKLLHVVLRNIPIEINPEEIMEDLVAQNFHPHSVHRMKNQNKKPIPLILVKLPKNEKNIFQIKDVNGLITTVETLRNKTGTGQCFRCQKFGHSSKHCHAPPRCVKCGNNHLSTDCPMPKESEAHCANCNKNHPASYKGCEFFKTTKNE